MGWKAAILLFVGVAVVAGLAAWGTAGLIVSLRDSLTGPVASPSASPSADSTGGWPTYRNEEYGFTISYPPELSPEQGFKRFHALGNSWRVNVFPGEEGKGILAIPVFRVDRGEGDATGKPYPLYFTAEVRIGVGADARSVENCMEPDAGYEQQERATVKLGDATFERFAFDGAAMMQYIRGASYRAVHDGRCYVVEAVRAGSTYRDDLAPGIPDAELDRYFSRADEVARSFRFVD